MRKLVIALLLSLASTAGALVAINMGVFQGWFERKASELVGAPVQLGRVTLAYRWPLRVQIGPTVTKHPLLDLRFGQAEIEAIKMTAPAHVRIKLIEPKVKLGVTLSHGTGSGDEGTVTITPEKNKPTPHLTVQIVKGEFESLDGTVSNLNLYFDQKQLLRSAAQIKMDATIRATNFPVPLPIQFQTDALTLSGEVVKSASMAA